MSQSDITELARGKSEKLKVIRIILIGNDQERKLVVWYLHQNLLDKTRELVFLLVIIKVGLLKEVIQ